MPAHNYREIPITLDGQTLLIGGFGHAFKEGTFESLHEDHNIGAVVSLAENYMDEFTLAGMDARYYTHIEIDDWVGVPFKHAKRIEPSIYENVYDAVKFARKAGLKIAIHCEEGRGRTGTVIATLKLRELLEKAYLANPALIEAEQIKSKRLDIVDFDEKQVGRKYHAAVTPFVKEAVDYVRSFDNLKQDTHNTSIETLNDVETLLLYERYLRSKFALGEKHVDILKAFLESKDSEPDVNLVLEEAVKNGRGNVIKVLIDIQHPNLNINAEMGYKGELRGPLYIAALRGHAEVVGVLLNVPLDEDINEALQDVITNEDMADDVKVKVVRAFVDSNHSELNINEALKLVIERSNNINVIKTLLESDDPDLDINKAFKTAINYGNEETIKILMESKHVAKLDMDKIKEIANKNQNKKDKIIAILQNINKVTTPKIVPQNKAKCLLNENKSCSPVVPSDDSVVIIHTKTPGTLFLSRHRSQSMPARPNKSNATPTSTRKSGI